ncbi:class I SAM-dependent RNA methyltransferase [Kineococcus gynurae]|uniref:Class I SAM-dependent RNA methyltransferase n=1 Tax=Kineococcus gynurae TaxID=452979 RepID=A0ABV5LV21_9ACTN
MRPRRATRPRPAGAGSGDAVGQVLELEVGPVAHGGHCVARHEGRVVFVRHALPGELVRARVTEGGATKGFWRADAVEVLRAAPGRRPAPCPVARPGGCGGCDFQHATPATQRDLKAAVVAEQLQRLAGLTLDVVVEPVDPGTVVGTAQEGLRWRRRTQFAVDAEGRPGLRRHRSHAVVPLRDCPISSEAVLGTGVLEQTWGGVETVEVAAGTDGPPLLVVHPAAGAHPRLPRAEDVSLAVRTPGGLHRVAGRTWVAETVRVRETDHAFRVSGAGFWQVHPQAAPTLAGAVLDALDPRPGDRCLDLYAGSGLFTAVLAEAVGLTGTVVAVEGEARAVKDARRSLHGRDQVRLVVGDVARVLGTPDGPAGQETGELVVLDPPRSGAGREVVGAIAARAPRVVAYVACDPAALARDVAWFAELGYRLDGLRAFDLFPNTHHVECVARLVPLG